VLPAYLEEAIADRLDIAESLAYTMWRKTQGSNVPLDDLKGQAYLGLVLAANLWLPHCERNGYDPNDLSFFSVYARHRIYGELVEHLRSLDWATRTTRARAKMLRAISEAEELTEEEMAERSGLSLKQVRRVLTVADNGHHTMSPDMLAAASEVSHSLRTQAPEGSRFEREVLDLASDFIETLPEETVTIISLHYYMGHDLHIIAKMLGLTEVKVSKIHSTALLRLHSNLKTLTA